MILLLPVEEKFFARGRLHLGAIEQLGSGVLCHHFETSVFADGVKFFISGGRFELVETVLLEFFAVIGRSGLFLTLPGLDGLAAEVQLHRQIRLQSRITVVPMSNVQILHPEATGGVLEAFGSGVSSAVQRSHIN